MSEECDVVAVVEEYFSGVHDANWAQANDWLHALVARCKALEAERDRLRRRLEADDVDR